MTPNGVGTSFSSGVVMVGSWSVKVTPEMGRRSQLSPIKEFAVLLGREKLS